MAVRGVTVAGREELARVLAPLRRYLAGVALAGFPDRDAVAADLGLLGATRVCAPGSLQCPPLDWPRDGHPPLASLAKGIQD